MKRTVRTVLFFALVAHIAAQEVVIGTPWKPVYQDPHATILGAEPNGGPLPFEQLPKWGPRSYTGAGECLNLSCRADVGTDNQRIFAGFVVSPGNGVMLIRAVGPSLAKFDVPRPLERPRLEVFDASGKSVAVAVAWSQLSELVKGEIRQAAKDVGAFSLLEGSEDRVLLAYLQAGSYTAIVSSEQAAGGTVILEVYRVGNVTSAPPPPPPPPTPPTPPPGPRPPYPPYG